MPLSMRVGLEAKSLERKKIASYYGKRIAFQMTDS